MGLFVPLHLWLSRWFTVLQSQVATLPNDQIVLVVQAECVTGKAASTRVSLKYSGESADSLGASTGTMRQTMQSSLLEQLNAMTCVTS